MKIKFTAKKITYEINKEESYYMVGFLDNDDEPDQYVILQRAITFDDQDIKLGMNTYYFEFSDQSNSGYGVCKNVKLENNKVYFNLNTTSVKNIEVIEITFENKIIKDWNKFKDIFNNIFEDVSY